MKVGLMTGGGDCPGLNAVIRAVVHTVDNAGGQCAGVEEGWRGLIEGNVRPLSVDETDDIIAVASEEVSLNRLFPGQALNTREPPPGSYDTWSIST